MDHVICGRSRNAACVHGPGTSPSLRLLSRGMVLDFHPGVVRGESGLGVAGIRVPTAPLTRGCVGDTCSIVRVD